MHSFLRTEPLPEDDRFCLTTVDTIFREEEFSRFIDAFKAFEGDGMMAVTDYIDDEKPLYIGTDEDRNITGFYDTLQPDTRYISGGNLLSVAQLNRCNWKNVWRRVCRACRNFSVSW